MQNTVENKVTMFVDEIKALKQRNCDLTTSLLIMMEAYHSGTAKAQDIAFVRKTLTEVCEDTNKANLC